MHLYEAIRCVEKNFLRNRGATSLNFQFLAKKISPIYSRSVADP